MGLEDNEVKHKIITEFDRLKSERGTLDSNWAEVARIASPRDNVFNRDVTPGENLRQYQYDETAELTLDRATANYGAITTPQNQRWHSLRTSNRELNKIYRVREYFEEVTSTLFAYRYNPEANFSANKYEGNRSLLGFGNGILYIGEGDGRVAPPLWYKAMHLAEMYFTENNRGLIDKTFRHFKMTIRQLIEEYGKANVPESVRNKPEEEMVEVLWAVQPNPDWDPTSLNMLKKRYISHHLLRSGGSAMENEAPFLRVGGFDTFPLAIDRDSRSIGEPYGRGTLQKVLPAISMLNQIKRTHIKTSHHLSDPIRLMKDDSSVDVNDLRPGHVVVGGLDAQGNPNVKPMETGGRPDVSKDLLEDTKMTIKEAFLMDLYLMNLEGRDRVTATEIMERSQEKGRLMTPLGDRTETESLYPQVDREIEILERGGYLPEPPPELVEADGEYEIEFTSPLTLSQKSDQALGAIRFSERVMQAAEFNPEILDVINWDEYANIVHEAEGAPISLMNDEETIEGIRGRRAQEQQMQQLTEAAPGVGSAVLDVAKAEQVANGGE